MANYPEVIDAGNGVTAKLLDGKYFIAFPFSRPVLAAFKSAFAGAAPKFDGETKTWSVAKRHHKSISDRLAVVSEAVVAEKSAATEKFKSGAQILKNLAPFENGAKSIPYGTTFELKTAYHYGIVEICRALDGRWDAHNRVWVMPLSRAADFAEKRDRIQKFHDAAVAAVKAKAEEKAKRAAERAAECATRPEKLRYLALANSSPSVGTVAQIRGKWMKIEGRGKVFRADESTSSISDLVGVEGEAVHYVYYTQPSESEIQAAEAEVRLRGKCRPPQNCRLYSAKLN